MVRRVGWHGLRGFFILVATAIEAAGLLNQFTPLVLLGNGPYTSALSPSQLQALAFLPGDLASIDYTIHTVFFGLDILVFAYLVLRSAFLPRTIGVLLAIDGLAYLCYSFTDILAPQAAAHLVPWILLSSWPNDHIAVRLARPGVVAEGGTHYLVSSEKFGRYTLDRDAFLVGDPQSRYYAGRIIQHDGRWLFIAWRSDGGDGRFLGELSDRCR